MNDDIQIQGSWLGRVGFPRDLLIYSKGYKTENRGDRRKCSVVKTQKKKKKREKPHKNNNLRGR